MVLVLWKGVKINNSPFAYTHTAHCSPSCTDFDFSRASTVICSVFLFVVGFLRRSDFFFHFSGDYYMGPRRSNRAIPFAWLHLFFYCSFFIYLVFLVYVVCATMKANDLFHISPKTKTEKNFSPIVVFRFILLAGSTVIELYYNMYGPRNDDIYLNILLQHIHMIFRFSFILGSFSHFAYEIPNFKFVNIFHC